MTNQWQIARPIVPTSPIENAFVKLKALRISCASVVSGAVGDSLGLQLESAGRHDALGHRRLAARLLYQLAQAVRPVAATELR
ncbi:hypothetical protein [Bosea sp. PAMC 26642]|uniref:hypothetical protein n=1 Tax=Bosea sp. (strain PAMC 26642) TaxID=1792307 RepID=UPI0007700D47|nr:hypothetical protein [Bosea sp. PAMC 26642]AMJ61605.1 hypothetical protein AXW83_15975 [Bosea sp. PAMC 26642]